MAHFEGGRLQCVDSCCFCSFLLGWFFVVIKKFIIWSTTKLTTPGFWSSWWGFALMREKRSSRFCFRGTHELVFVNSRKRNKSSVTHLADTGYVFALCKTYVSQFKNHDDRKSNVKNDDDSKIDISISNKKIVCFRRGFFFFPQICGRSPLWCFGLYHGESPGEHMYSTHHTCFLTRVPRRHFPQYRTVRMEIYIEHTVGYSTRRQNSKKQNLTLNWIFF